MSLEESMKDLAASNRELAEAQREYANVIREHGTQAVLNGSAATPENRGEKPAVKTKAEKPATKTKTKVEEKEEDDGFGDDNDNDNDEVLTHDDVKKLLIQVKDTNGDKEDAFTITRKYGYETIPKIQEKDFANIARDARAWLKKNG